MQNITQDSSLANWNALPPNVLRSEPDPRAEEHRRAVGGLRPDLEASGQGVKRAEERYTEEEWEEWHRLQRGSREDPYLGGDTAEVRPLFFPSPRADHNQHRYIRGSLNFLRESPTPSTRRSRWANPSPTTSRCLTLLDANLSSRPCRGSPPLNGSSVTGSSHPQLSSTTARLLLLRPEFSISLFSPPQGSPRRSGCV